MKARLAVFFIPLVLVAQPTRATNIPIAGKVSVTKTAKLAKMVSKSDTGFALPAPGSPEDPTVGGAELQFFDTAAPGAGHMTSTLDATGPCYHTNQDEVAVVDFDKLEEQIRIALDLAIEMANTSTQPIRR